MADEQSAAPAHRVARIRWGIGDVFWALGAQFLAANLSFLVLGLDGDVTTEEFLAVGLPVQSLGLLAALMVISRRKGRGSLSADFGFRVSIRDWTAVLVGLGWRVVLVLVLVPLILLIDDDEPAQEIVRDLEEIETAIVWASVVVFVAAVQPALEEVLFRGLLLRALLRRLSPVGAIVVSGLAFGVVHLLGASWGTEALVTVVGLSGFGMVLAGQALRHGSLSRPVLTHAAFNATVLLALAAGA